MENFYLDLCIQFYFVQFYLFYFIPAVRGGTDGEQGVEVLDEARVVDRYACGVEGAGEGDLPADAVQHEAYAAALGRRPCAHGTQDPHISVQGRGSTYL